MLLFYYFSFKQMKTERYITVIEDIKDTSSGLFCVSDYELFHLVVDSLN